jgi:hypothetical protein
MAGHPFHDREQLLGFEMNREPFDKSNLRQRLTGFGACSKVFGSGSINAWLDFAIDPARTLRADMRRIIPDGPLTPDIAVRRFAFVVDRKRIDKVVVLLDGKELGTFDLP